MFELYLVISSKVFTKEYVFLLLKKSKFIHCKILFERFRLKMWQEFELGKRKFCKPLSQSKTICSEGKFCCKKNLKKFIDI